MFELLRKYDWYGISEEIEIAKGKYELPTTADKYIKQRKRRKQWQTKKG